MKSMLEVCIQGFMKKILDGFFISDIYLYLRPPNLQNWPSPPIYNYVGVEKKIPRKKFEKYCYNVKKYVDCDSGIRNEK